MSGGDRRAGELSRWMVVMQTGEMEREEVGTKREREAASTGEIWGVDRRFARGEGEKDPEHGWNMWDGGLEIV